TTERLADYEIFAAPIEQAADVRPASVLVAVGDLSRGFRLPDASLQLWAETDVFEEEKRTHERRRSCVRFSSSKTSVSAQSCSEASGSRKPRDRSPTATSTDAGRTSAACSIGAAKIS